MPAICGRVVRAARASDRVDHTETEEANANGALEVARQNIQDIRETRELLARIYDQVAHRRGSSRAREHESSDETSTGLFASDDSESDRSTTTTSSSDGEEDDEEEEEEYLISLLSRSENIGQARNGDVVGAADAAHDHDNTTTTTTTTTVATDDESDDTNNSNSDNNLQDQTATFDEQEDSSTSDPTGDINRVSADERQQRTHCVAIACRNRSAMDCTNNLCGRCCVLMGEFHCPRHNS
jgi:hypothetical protein